MKKKVLIVVNPYASGGRGLKLLPAIQAAAPEYWETVEIVTTEKIEDVPIALEKGYTDGFDTVLAVGGDGTNNVTLNHLMTLRETYPEIANLTYGVIPAGTGDDWASMLKIPTDPAKAVAWLAGREPQMIDIVQIQVDDRPQYYLNVASVGVGFEVNEWLEDHKSAFMPYAQATLRLIFTYEAPTLKITIDDVEFYHGLLFVAAIANGSQFGAGMKVAPSASIDDGLLDVMCIEGDSPWTAVTGLGGVFFGLHTRMRKVHMQRGKHIIIECEHEIGLEIEGHRELGQRIVCEVIPQSFRMLV